MQPSRWTVRQLVRGAKNQTGVPALLFSMRTCLQVLEAFLRSIAGAHDSDLNKVVRIAMTISVSSADVERSFSSMSAIKTSRR